MSETPSELDKRTFPRVKDSCRIRYRTVDAANLPEAGTEALSVNISGGGVRFRTEEPIPPGKLLVVEMELPDHEATVIALGRAVWCRDGEVGMEFWWVGWGDDGAQRAISDCVRASLEPHGVPTTPEHGS